MLITSMRRTNRNCFVIQSIMVNSSSSYTNDGYLLYLLPRVDELLNYLYLCIDCVWHVRITLTRSS